MKAELAHGLLTVVDADGVSHLLYKAKHNTWTSKRPVPIEQALAEFDDRLVAAYARQTVVHTGMDQWHKPWRKPDFKALETRIWLRLFPAIVNFEFLRGTQKSHYFKVVHYVDSAFHKKRGFRIVWNRKTVFEKFLRD